MKKCKRLSTLFLALCLLLSMAVPAVWAEETQEIQTVTHRFDIRALKNEGLVSSISGNSLFNVATTGLGDETKGIAVNYNNGKIDWKVKAYSFTTDKANDVSFSQYDYFRGRAAVGDWVAFTIKNPGAGKWGLSLGYIVTTSGAEEMNVYILPGSAVTSDDTAVNDIARAIQSAEALGAVNCYDTAGTVTNDTPKGTAGDPTHEIKKASTELKDWTAGDPAQNPEYILVFESAKANAEEKAHLYFSSLTMTQKEEEQVPDEPEQTNVKYRFDVRVLKTEGVVSNLNGNSLFNSETTGLGNESMGTVWNYNQGNINWKVAAYSFTTDRENDVSFTSYDYFRGRASVGDWVALTVKNPGAGKWGLSLEYIVTTSGAEGMDVYILPSSAIKSDDTAVNDIAKAMDKAEPVGTVSCYDDTGVITNDTPKNTDNGANMVKKVNTVLGDWIAGEPAEYPEYILVFASAKENPTGKSHLYFSSLTMSYGGAAALPDVPEEPDEEPEKDTVELVKSELAYEAIIPSYTPRIMAAGEVNGHDYVYVVLQGSVLLVYDLDERKMVDTEKLSWSTPRSIYVDENGILWMGGSDYNLYRYDPVSGNAQAIFTPGKEIFPNASSFNMYGLTGDGNGKLYFGTYNAGYFGMYDTVTNQFTCLSDGMLHEDSQFAGYGGVTLKDGYAYFCVDGNRNGDAVMTHHLVKFNLTTNKIDAYFDASTILGSTKYFTNVNVVGDTMIASTGAVLVAVDINTMTEVKLPELEHGYFGDISVPLDGKVYLMDRGENADGGRGLLEWDLEKNTMTPTGNAFLGSLNNSQCVVTVEGLPGKSLVLYKSGEAGVNLIIYNPESGQSVVLENITAGMASGAGNQLRTVIASVDGKTMYVSAYGNNQLAVYDVATGQRTQIFKTYSHQIEGLYFYEGQLYSGHYGQGGITMIDLEKETATPLYTLEYGAFNQHRSHAFTAGDGKVFLGTAPCLGALGGLISWYDIDANRIYVAAGPDADDVYYTTAGLLDAEGNVIKQVWYSAVTNEAMDFDEDNDGVDDSYITLDVDSDGDGEKDSVQRFHGVIQDQTPICLIYKNGYIYGCTSRAGGSGSDNTGVGNACLFVYDVNAMKVVTTLDISKAIKGLTTPVEFIDVIAEDPDVDGKFWGVVSDTLFSFTFDMEKKAFNVKEEMSLGKLKYNHGNNTWQSRDIIFDGDFMYVVFGSNGTYMINREDVSVCYQISAVVPKKMALAADGNLYFINKDNQIDLQVLPIAQTAQKIKDPYEAADVQAMINALDAAADITLEDEATVLAARAAYEALSEAGKALVTDTGKLTAAEAAIAPLRAAADKAAADPVIAKINAIGTVTLDSEAAIVAARSAYDALTQEQKALVSNLNVLTAAEAAFEKLTDPDENPKTGDMMPAAMLVGMVLISAAALAMAGGFKRKEV